MSYIDSNRLPQWIAISQFTVATAYAELQSTQNELTKWTYFTQYSQLQRSCSSCRSTTTILIRKDIFGSSTTLFCVHLQIIRLAYEFICSSNIARCSSAKKIIDKNICSTKSCSPVPFCFFSRQSRRKSMDDKTNRQEYLLHKIMYSCSILFILAVSVTKESIFRIF